NSSTNTINLSLLLFLTQVNHLEYILAQSIKVNNYTLFKVKYIVLYHLVSSLDKLRNDATTSNDLTSRSIKYIDDIISDVSLQELIAKRQFRNILVHYGIPPALEPILSSTAEFYGLVEHFFNGRT